MFKNKKIKKLILLFMLVFLLTINFMTSFLSNATIGNQSFADFQYDSENLVKFKMNYDKLDDKSGNCDYGLCRYDNTNNEYLSYGSQFGLQGYIFSFLNNVFKINIKILQGISSFIFAVVLVVVCYFIRKKYDNLLGIIFYVVFLFSPWITAFARNLYWVPFTWFIPLLLGLMYSIFYKKKRIFIPLIFLSIFIKCLCGYEYITTIMLSTIIFFLIDLFIVKDEKRKVNIFKTIFVVGIVCLLAFSSALIIHSYKRGNGNILAGLESVYKTDVLRRTIITTDKESYTGIVRESMDASVIEVLKRYIYGWNTDVLYGLDKELFPLMIVSSFIICVINLLENYKYKKRDFIMYLLFLVSCVSWFVLAKSHSYIHRGMNYVMWYFGFIQICMYIIIKFIINKLNSIKLKEI